MRSGLAFRLTAEVALFAVLTLAGVGAASAAIARPNVLDRRVTAISAQSRKELITGRVFQLGWSANPNNALRAS